MAHVDCLVTSLLSAFDREMSLTRGILARVPTDRFTWYPHPQCLTLGGLANHVMNMPLWVNFILAGSRWDLADIATAERETAESTTELVALFAQNVREARAALAAATLQQLNDPWSLIRNEDVVLTLSRAAAVQQMVLNHLALHREQLSSYLRQIPASITRYPEAMFEFPESAAALAAPNQMD